MAVWSRAVRGVRNVAFVASAVLASSTQSALAQTTVTLPATTQSSTLSAAVPEQARITVPAGLSFGVDNISTSTSQGNIAISVQNIALTTATKQLRISLTANAVSFTPPAVGAATWTATDVSWNAGPGGGPNAWQNATGSAGTLSSASYNTVAICDADTTSCSIAKLTFSLAAKPTVKRSGAHTLIATWKFESIGS
jgi:hypothetical protein